MATRIRLFAAFGALVTAVILVIRAGRTVPAPGPVTCVDPASAGQRRRPSSGR